MRLNNKIVNWIICGLAVIVIAFGIGCGEGGGGGGGDSGGDNPTTPSSEPVIPDTTKVLDDSTLQYLSSVSGDGSTFTFNDTTSQLDSLTAGDVIVIGVTDNTPYGVLRKVTSKTTRTLLGSSTQVEVPTTQATLEEAITKGSIETSAFLTGLDLVKAVPLQKGVTLKTFLDKSSVEGFFIKIPDVVLYDNDGDNATTNDQIRADGSLSINPSFGFSAEFDNGLKKLDFTNTTTETAELEIVGEVNMVSVDYSTPVYELYFTPITVWVGWVPVIFTPKLTVYIGVNGDVSVGITTSVTQEATLTLGVTYENNNWNSVHSFSNDFSYTPPTLSAGCSVKGYAKPQLELLLYGVIGPYANIEGYLELDADLLSTPWWVLYGGLSSYVGVEIKIFSHVIAGYSSPDLIGFKKILDQAEVPPEPTIDVQPTSLNFDSVNVGSTKDITFTVTNIGTGTLTGSASGLSAPFSYVGSTNYFLGQGESKNITVRFSPTSTVYSSDYAEFSGGNGKSCKVEGTGSSGQSQSDLIIQNFSVIPNSGFSSSNATVNFTIYNQGSGTANASTTNIRINTSSTNVTVSDTLLTSISTPAIAAGGTYIVSPSVTIPSNRPSGTNYIWVILDVNHTANQSNEANDKAYVTFNVTSGQVERITNGSFSSGTSGWTLWGDFWAGTTLTNYRTPPGYAAGGVDSNGYAKNNACGYMYQTVAIPSNATSATLSFWYNITSNETGSSAYDVLNVTLQNSSGNHLATITVLSNLHKMPLGVYNPIMCDVTPYKGQTIRVRFLATTDSTNTTMFRIDDVSLMSDGN